MIHEYNFNAGMSAVISPEILPEDMAADIVDMYLDKNGTWKALGLISKYNLSLPTDLKHLFDWNPANMPDGYAETEPRIVYVAFDVDGKVYLCFYVDTATLTTVAVGTYESSGVVQAACDSVSFLFVDGRDNSNAKRIRINEDGSIQYGEIGIDAPTQKAELLDITTDISSNEGTGVSIGSTLTYSYCYLNEFGERSNPAPLLVIDSYQWQYKGSITDDNKYLYGDKAGVIKSVSISTEISSSEVRSVELYRGVGEYNESSYPLESLKLVAIQSVNQGASSIIFTDSTFGSESVISYENNQSPKGDDIAIISGTTFIANANPGLALLNASLHRITLTNKNEFNYINQWFRIDLHDEISKRSGQAHLELNWSSVQMSSVRFVASDMISGLRAIVYDELNMIDLVGAGNSRISYKSRMMAWIEIPFVAAFSETDIYLCVFPGDIPDQFPMVLKVDPGVYDFQTNIKKLYDERMPQCPVRNQFHLVSQNKQQGTSDLPASVKAKISVDNNKANAYYNSAIAMNDIGGVPFIYDEYGAYLQNDLYAGGNELHVLSDVAVMASLADPGHYEYQKDSVLCPSEGWASVYCDMLKICSYTATESIIQIISGSTGIIHVYWQSDSGSYFTIACRVLLPGGNEDVRSILTLTANYTAIKFYVFVTWKYEYAASPHHLKATVWILYKYYDEPNDIWTDMRCDKLDEFGVSNTSRFSFGKLLVKYSAADMWGVLSNVGNINLSGYGYYPERHQFLAAIRNTPIFGSDYIGAYDKVLADINGIARCYNDNVVFKKVQNASASNKSSVGTILWGKYGSMPALNVENIGEEIIRISPEKSHAPTDEHNTLIIFTNKRRLRLALFSSGQTSVIVDHELIGISNPMAMAVIPGGVAWCDKKLGIFVERYGEYRNISRGFIDLSENCELCYDKLSNWLWVGDEFDEVKKRYSNVFIYNFNNETWFRSGQYLTPRLVSEYRGESVYINPILSNVACTIDYAKPAECYILTRSFTENLRVKRISLMGLLGEAGKIDTIISGFNTPLTTSSYSAQHGERVGLVGCKAPQIQFKLQFKCIWKLIIERKFDELV